MASRKNNEISLNIGTSSILFIFVTLCLISFSILSLASSLSDNKLSRKVLDYTYAYSEACNQAYDKLEVLDESLKATYETGISRTGYFDAVGKKTSFAVPVSDIQALEVEISILYPESSGEPFYKITKWQITTVGSLDYDDSLPVLQ